MLDNINTEQVLFLDIETTSQHQAYAELNDKYKKFWDKKAQWMLKEEETPEEIYKRAAIYAEFGKVICISSGFISMVDGRPTLRVKSFYGKDEKQLLEGFANLLNTKPIAKPEFLLCAHNGKEFDFPYISRRMLVNGVKLPKKLDTAGKKPWEVAHLDTMELWKFGDYKHFTSIELLCELFNIPGAKEGMHGGDVYHVFWEDDDLPRIVDYCQNDVLLVAQLFLRYKGEALIKPEDVIIA